MFVVAVAVIFLPFKIPELGFPRVLVSLAPPLCAFLRICFVGPGELLIKKGRNAVLPVVMQTCYLRGTTCCFCC